jgi:putative ABC transport system permease protein
VAWDRAERSRVVHAPRDLLAIAAEGLGRYKLRTALSVVGVVLGVAAVIAMMSVTEGARREALAQVELMGLDNLVVRTRIRDTSAGASPSRGLTARDAQSVRDLVPLVNMVSPLTQRYLPVIQGSQRTMAVVLGVNSQYQAILRLRLERGRFLSPVDERSGAAVCVIGAPLARALFGYRAAMDGTLKIDGRPFRVIGVLAERGTGSQTTGALAWRDLNQAVLVPIQTLLGHTIDIAPAQQVDELWVRVLDDDRVEAVGAALGHALTGIHRADDVEVVVPRELLAQRFQTQRTFSVVVGTIAVIALLVGGIGIMNVMLTSVVERTREIGLRRTVGATQRDITLQFLTESLLMTVSGGLLGIAIGAVSASVITAYAGWSTHVSATAVVSGVLVSLVVGLGFGVFPAMRAARLQPVDAVRHE